MKRVGSWGIMPKLDLKSWRPIDDMSIPSTIIFPPTGSTRRNKAPIRVDFPLPVLPTIPILCPPSKVQLIPCSTSGALGLYCIWKFLCISVHLTFFLNNMIHILKIILNYLQVFYFNFSYIWPIDWRMISFTHFLGLTWYMRVLIYPFYWYYIIF